MQAYEDAVLNWSPDDLFVLKKGVETHYATMTLDQLLAFLQLSRWDAHVFAACMPYLVAQIETAGPAECDALRAGAHQAWATYLPIGETVDVAFAVGSVLYGLGWPAEALALFEQSLQFAGEDPSTTYNIAMCHSELGDRPSAREWLTRTARLDPAFELLREHDVANL
jgi:tetratricopeptide (TPR) repeat protein